MRFEFARESSLHMSMSNRCAIICCELLNFSEYGFNGKRPVAPPTRRTVPAVSVKRSGTRSARRLFGHCFGGQLLATALGGVVSNIPEPEIGWGECEVEHNELACEWFGITREFLAYQWHFETFSTPQNAMRILRGANCENQAFVLGPRIGLQPHIEVDEHGIKLGAEKDRAMQKKLSGPGAHSYSTILKEMKKKLPAMRAVTQQVYGVWLANVRERQMSITSAVILRSAATKRFSF